MRGVGHPDVHEEVLLAREVEEAEHLRTREQAVAECLVDLERVLMQAHRDQRFEADPRDRGIDLGSVPANDLEPFEPTHPSKAARRGQADAGGELLVRQPSIILQGVDDLVINSVELRFHEDISQTIRSNRKPVRTICWGMQTRVATIVLAILTGCAATPGETGEDELPAGTSAAASGSSGEADPGDGGMSTGGSDTGAGSEGADDASFVEMPDGGGSGVECSVWDQDCPDGEKCMPWANDGGLGWNAAKCVPVAANPGEPGDDCTAEGGGLSGVDDCDVGSMCWNVHPETAQGVCVALCSGSSQAPMCADPATSCSITNNGVLTLCLTLCDPLVQDCAQGEACYAGLGTDSFFCSPNTAAEGLGEYGDPCEYINVCNPGLFCAIPEAVPDCVASSGCCSEFCETTGGDDQCSGEGQSCVPYWEEGQAPPAYENVGVCLLPL